MPASIIPATLLTAIEAQLRPIHFFCIIDSSFQLDFAAEFRFHLLNSLVARAWLRSIPNFLWRRCFRLPTLRPPTLRLSLLHSFVGSQRDFATGAGES
jgi:hypothetical protein